MRILFGTLIGVLLGGAIVAGLTSICNVQAYWPILIVGLVAGVMMRWLASSDSVSYLRGGLAALATVLSMIGGPLVGANLISQQKLIVQKVDASTNAAEVAAVKNADTGEAIATELPPVSLPSRVQGTIGKQRRDANPLDVVLLTVGCLLAYQIGKSRRSTGISGPEEGPEKENNESDSCCKEKESDEETTKET